MKYKNRQKRLEARIKDWELIRPDRSEKGGKVKIVAGAAFNKPGSHNK